MSSRHYLSFWRDESVDVMFCELGHRPVVHGASSQYGKLEPGDTVWVLTEWRDGSPALVGRIVVGERTTRARAARKLGLETNGLWPSKHHILAKAGERYPLRNIDLTRVVDTLAFAPGQPAVPPTGPIAARFAKMRELAPAAAELFARLWSESRPMRLPPGYSRPLYWFGVERPN